MDTKIYSEADLPLAAAELRKGNLVAFPTETVYGLGADALLEEAVKKVYAAKGRPSDNPLIVHVTGLDMVKDYVDNFPPVTEKLITHFWPGPLTLIFTIKKGSLAAAVTGGLSTAAFRMPDNKKTLKLIELTGAPLVGPSANTSGKPSPTTAQHVAHDLKDKIAGIVDDGPTMIGVESTVLDLSGAAPLILRPGAVTKEQLEAVLDLPVEYDAHLVKESETPKAPGMKYKHYAPNTKVLLVHDQDWAEAVSWAKREKLRPGIAAGPAIIKAYGQNLAVYPYDDDSAAAGAKGLFSGLRYLDEQPVDVIFLQVFPNVGIGSAYMNRAKKSASQNYFTK